ncbi:MAG TPA: hypothetical protein PLW65_12925 [Pseudomonadota bacterium]|nr:hypothetical protein [Pseudomonadota bacterium]
MKRLQSSIYSLSALALLTVLGLTGCPQESKEEGKGAQPAAAPAPVTAVAPEAAAPAGAVATAAPAAANPAPSPEASKAAPGGEAKEAPKAPQ